MYVDMQIKVFDVGSGKFLVEVAVGDKDGRVIGLKTFEKVSLSTGLRMSQAFYAATVARMKQASAADSQDEQLPLFDLLDDDLFP